MQFYKAKVFHARQGPTHNRFTYGGLYFSFWLSEEGEEAPRFFSWERFNLFSFYRKDHGKRDGTSLREWALEQLEQAGLNNFKGKIRLVTMPRMLGYVFNPVSFWYCYEGEELKAVICEVNNTFGESHNYVVRDPLKKKKAPMDKWFHVSPFYPVQGQYMFDFSIEDFVSIEYKSEHSHFIATMKGTPYQGSLITLFLSKPLYTLLVVFLIHYQALKLFMKRTPFFTKPKQRKELTTFRYIEGDS